MRHSRWHVAAIATGVYTCDQPKSKASFVPLASGALFASRLFSQGRGFASDSMRPKCKTQAEQALSRCQHRHSVTPACPERSRTGVPPALLTLFPSHLNLSLFKRGRPHSLFSTFPSPIPAAAPPQTTPPPPPPTHSTTAPAQSSESKPGNRIASVSIHAILRPHPPAQSQPHP